MTFQQQITNDLKESIKARDQLRTSSLRMLKAALKNKQVEQGKELTDQDVQGVISSLVRKGQEAAKEYRNGGREELALKEEKEVGIFLGYLPEQLGSGEIEKVLKEIISELGIESPKDLGKLMKTSMARLAGKAQGKEVNEIARKLLSESR